MIIIIVIIMIIRMIIINILSKSNHLQTIIQTSNKIKQTQIQNKPKLLTK